VVDGAAGLLYVPEWNAGRIRVYNLSTLTPYSTPIIGTGLFSGGYVNGLSLNPVTKELYAGDSNRIQVLDGNAGSGFGSLLRSVSGPSPSFVQYDPSNGLVYLGYSPDHSVQAWDLQTGLMVGAFGSQGSGPGQFNTCSGVQPMANGRLMATDSYIGRLQFFRHWYTPPSGGGPSGARLLGPGNKATFDPAIKGKLLAAPNPAKKEFTAFFDLAEDVNSARLDLFNLAGDRVRSWDFDVLSSGRQRCNLSLAGIPPGAYLLTLAVKGTQGWRPEATFKLGVIQ
jgi:WD40 repeat protein